MIEVIGNLWTFPADIRVITTNGTIKKDGSAVMGRGCAREAKVLLPGIDRTLGKLLASGGNRVHVLKVGTFNGPTDALVSFPVKHEWNQKADLDLIRQSAVELVALAGQYSHAIRIVVPRPGCGNGQRDWETEVKPILESISGFDERFHVISFK